MKIKKVKGKGTKTHKRGNRGPETLNELVHLQNQKKTLNKTMQRQFYINNVHQDHIKNKNSPGKNSIKSGSDPLTPPPPRNNNSLPDSMKPTKVERPSFLNHIYVHENPIHIHLSQNNYHTPHGRYDRDSNHQDRVPDNNDIQRFMGPIAAQTFQNTR